MENSLRPFFAPKGIVVIGASSKETKLGYGISRNIIRSGYKGNLFLVNPKGGNLFGKEVYKDLNEIKGEADLGILVIPSNFVLNSIKECKEFGIKSIVIVSGGFSEAGSEGKRLEREIEDHILENQIKVIGPNCIGVYDSNFPLDVTFLPTEELKPGKIALISHSGAICGAILDWSQAEGFGLSRMASLGNQIDVNETDILEYFGHDEDTAVITMYLEGISDGKRFIDVSKEISTKKPIVVLKAGISDGSKKAIESHTGALAGSKNAFEAAARKAGVHSAKSLVDMYIWAETFQKSPLPKGNNVAILTNAGGPGVTAVDAIEEEGLKLAALGELTRSKLKAILPKSASINNPVDMLASASPEIYAESLKVLLDDQNIDSIILIIPPPPMFDALEVAKEISPIIKSSSKPIFVVLMGSELITEAKNFIDNEQIPEFRFPEQAASALTELYKRTKYLERNELKIGENIEVKSKLSSNDNVFGKVNPDGFMNDIKVFELLENYGTSIKNIRHATVLEDALRIAKYIYPVAMKIFSTKITHKSDVGGVKLNIQNEKECTEAYNSFASNFSINEEFEGVLIQEMASKGQEIILGAIRDPDFGPMIMFGSGGTEVEGLKDVSFAISKLTQNDIDHMFATTWAGKKLDGYRNFTKADKKAVQETIFKIERIMLDNPQIMDIEFNPLIVYPDGEGALVVDARIKLRV